MQHRILGIFLVSAVCLAQSVFGMERIDRYAGVYKLKPGIVAAITVKDARLFCQITGMPNLQLYRKSESEYAFKVQDWLLEFFKDDKGMTSYAVLRNLTLMPVEHDGGMVIAEPRERSDVRLYRVPDRAGEEKRFDGTWSGTLPGQDGKPVEVTHEFESVGRFLVGTVSTGSSGVQFIEGKIEGDTLSFFVETPEAKIYTSGTLSGDTIGMTRKVGDKVTRFTLKRIAPVPRDLTGDWQGTLDLGSRKHRVVVQVDNDNGNHPNGILRLPDQDFQPVGIDAIAQKGATVEFIIRDLGADYQGEIGPEGDRIDGTFSQNGKQPVPFTLHRATEETAWKDLSPHSVRFIEVDKDVKLEVLDWGGTGKALILLAGLGNDAHIFDGIAPGLAKSYRVYGITRRGFGRSGTPSFGYWPDRLGDDIIAVIDTLELDRPVLAGHSFSGEELTNVGCRYPEKVSGLVYLDGAYTYQNGIGDPPQGLSLPQASLRKELFTRRDNYTELKLPVLAIYRDDMTADILKNKVAPSARIVLLPTAGHYLFKSNETDVVRELTAFIDSLQ